MDIKEKIKNWLAHSRWMAFLFFKYRIYKTPLDEKSLRGRIQQVGHRLDLYLMQGMKAPELSSREFEYLLTEFAKRGYVPDEPFRWAIQLYIQATYGLAALQSQQTVSVSDRNPEEMERLVEIIRSRRSIRKWNSTPVDLGEIKGLIDVAKWSPSSCNRQLWQVMVVTESSQKEYLKDYFGNSFWQKAPVLLVILMETGLYGDHEKHFAYLDGAAFIQNLLLLLHEQKYGACWIGFTKWDSFKPFKADFVSQNFYSHFGLPEKLVPVSMIALGHYDAVPAAPSRQDLSNIITKVC